MAKLNYGPVISQITSGLRTAAVPGGVLICHLFSRGNLPDPIQPKPGAPGPWSFLSQPGIYVLADNSDGIREVYIGQADKVYKRLRAHNRDKNKQFWRDTAVIQLSDDVLTAGNLDYLEQNLIDKAKKVAKKTGDLAVSNVNVPEKTFGGIEKLQSDSLLKQALSLLQTFDFDFFGPPEPSPEPALNAESARIHPGMPQAVEPLLQRLRDTLVSGRPDTEFYSTRFDYRAKVTRGSHFRPYARLRIAKNAITVRLKDVGNFKLNSTEPITIELRQHIQQAYDTAVAYLDGKPRAARAAASGAVK